MPLHVAAVRRLAEDLKAYAHNYEQAALAEDPAGWWLLVPNPPKR